MTNDSGEDYDCVDCGMAVTRFGAPPDWPKLCAGCAFLQSIEDPEDQAQMRAYMLRTHQIGPYPEDPSCPG